MRDPSAWLLLLGLLAGCSGGAAPTTPQDDSGAIVDDTGFAGDDTGAPVDDATPPTDAVVVDDGGPYAARRLPCVPTTELAKDLPPLLYGAVEAELVSITPPGTKTSCPTDTGHVHLQLDLQGKRYDVAVNVESTSGAQMAIYTKDLAPQLGTLGYTNSPFDYPISLGVSSTQFTPLSKTALVSRLQTELKDAARVSIHGLTYDDGSGVHNVHRNGPGRDGAIIIRRGGAAGTDHVIALKFSTDTF